MNTEKRLFLIGLGMGSENLLTAEAKNAIESAEIIFGAARMLEIARKVLESGMESAEQTTVRFEPMYKAGEIAEFLKKHSEYKRAVVCFSGDTGFFSGAGAFFEESEEISAETERLFEENGRILSNAARLFADWEISVASGIASPVYFASKLHKSWQNWKMLSLHGAKCNAIEQIRKNPACFFILSGLADVKSLGERLETAIQNGVLSAVKCFLGENLSYPNEKIRELTPREMKEYRVETETEVFATEMRMATNGSEATETKATTNFPKVSDSTSSGAPLPQSLFVLLIENETPALSDLPTLRDENFLRAKKIPMTKQEVRRLSLCELALSKSSIVYDIGSGSGSVAAEAARVATGGTVYAVDSNEDAVSLTRANVEKFCLENVRVVHSEATEFLRNTEIPAPSHVFIGGSRGNLEEIIRLALAKNPTVRIVANFVTLENLCDMQGILKSLETENLIDASKVNITQIAVSRAERAGEFHLMKAQNPVWAVSFSGKSFAPPAKNKTLPQISCRARRTK